MQEQRKIISAVFLLVSIAALLFTIIRTSVLRVRYTSPVPESGAIRVIYLTPTPAAVPTENHNRSDSDTPQTP